MDAGYSIEDSILEGMTVQSKEGDGNNDIKVLGLSHAFSTQQSKNSKKNLSSTAKVSHRDASKNHNASVTDSVGASKIHSLYQDLYLTDLKNDVGELEYDLAREKEKNL